MYFHERKDGGLTVLKLVKKLAFLTIKPASSGREYQKYSYIGDI